LSNDEKTNSKTKCFGVSIIIILVLSVVLLFPTWERPSTQITNSQNYEQPMYSFSLASWGYPDQYGQGILNMTIQYYYNGSAVEADYYPTNSTISLIVDAEEDITIIVYSWLNNTLVGADDYNDAKNYFRHNASLFLNNGTEIFSQENFTIMLGGSDAYDPMFLYRHYVTLPSTAFVNTGTIYTCIITYEVFYPEV